MRNGVRLFYPSSSKHAIQIPLPPLSLSSFSYSRFPLFLSLSILAQSLSLLHFPSLSLSRLRRELATSVTLRPPFPLLLSFLHSSPLSRVVVPTSHLTARAPHPDSRLVNTPHCTSNTDVVGSVGCSKAGSFVLSFVPSKGSFLVGLGLVCTADLLSICHRRNAARPIPRNT